MHGGARGSGALKGERNGMWKHGGETLEAIALRRAAGRLLNRIGNNAAKRWASERAGSRHEQKLDELMALFARYARLPAHSLG